jgi:hypothetical protein
MCWQLIVFIDECADVAYSFCWLMFFLDKCADTVAISHVVLPQGSQSPWCRPGHSSLKSKFNPLTMLVAWVATRIMCDLQAAILSLCGVVLYPLALIQGHNWSDQLYIFWSIKIQEMEIGKSHFRPQLWSGAGEADTMWSTRIPKNSK